MPKTTYLGACALAVIACSLAGAASAQTAPQPTPVTPNDPGRPAGQTASETTSTNDTAQAPGPSTTDDRGDIVVTAQGRAQVLADVPLAVSAVNEAALVRSGASDIRQIAQIAPSLQVSSTGNEANGAARLRGIGTVGDNPGLESSVAVFVDGVYRSRSGVGLNELGDIERVEVLRGPQGTLFGRNASAGIISIISKSPDLNRLSAGGDVSYGNYNYVRVAGNVNVPLTETIAARFDGVYNKRDGFYHDVTNDVDVNNRDRYFLRGQLLFQPNSQLSVRLIADYTKRTERCCGAVFIDNTVAPANAGLLTTANPIIPVLVRLGQPTAAYGDPYSRNLYTSPGRTTAGKTRDYGVSGQVDYDLGDVKLTSITAYREYYNYQASDADYGYVDLLYRGPGPNAGRREFKTFSQEARASGKLFGDRLDWLVGGYYSHEDLNTRDNLTFGSQYGRFAACRILVGGALAAFANPAQAGCLSPAARAAVFPALFGAASPAIVAGFDRLDAVRNVGDTATNFQQKAENFAVFTHNIFEVAPGLKITAGLRYTHERKDLAAQFANSNVFCPAQQAALTPFLANAGLAAVAGALINLTCQGNSTSELTGQSLSRSRTDSQLTGTGIVSYKVTQSLLAYGSYSRGYKAGGFNLDRSALKSPILVVNGVPTTTFAAAGGVQSLAGNLQFDAEINNAFEVGAKFSSRPFSLNFAAFHQAFKNFQLNTFNGANFLVQNVNSCKTDLGSADRDNIASTGACAAGNSQAGVISEGVELEASINPSRYLTVNGGFTYAYTHYRNNLIGNQNGAPLDPALRRLPNAQLSNAPRTVTTSSVTWTPPIGHSGFSLLGYVDGRLSSDYNTGSDLFPQKRQDGFYVVNARVGVRGPNQRWAIEFWGQNIFNTNYTQVGFSSPYQAASTTPGATPGFNQQFYPGGTQIFSAFLAEPRTYGVTLRGRF